MKRLAAVILVVIIGSLFTGFVLLSRTKAQTCASRHADNFLGCFLAGPVAISVHVVGTVDRVSFYSTDDEAHAIATIVTNGKEVTETVSLPTSSQYYFVAESGDREYRGRTVGFDTMQTHADLTIRALDAYEGW